VKLLAVSVDLDEIENYHSIHGLTGDTPKPKVYDVAVPRLADWAEQRGLPLTWFVVGKDTEHSPNAEALSRLAARGDELACHSYSHHYDLSSRPPAEVRVEVERCVTALNRLGGVVSGFRAPGYTVSDMLLDVLRETGLRYDSSVLPSPAYYAAKAVKLASLELRGRKSKSVMDRPEVLRAPTVPYRVGRPYWFRGTGIWEIPIQVTPRARLPFIGTALTLAGASGARLLASRLVGESFVNLELHGIDALDERDGLGQLAPHQRDLRIAWTKKMDAVDAAVRFLQQKGYVCVRMDELAERAARS
jgi:peptidoglycan/xylan/chitin deacetylase (PgdA/CDA1 family)